MSEVLTSVGIDIGTSTTQLVVSHLTLENRASAFSVPRIAITGREIVYRSRIHFTPLRSDTVIDAQGVREIVAGEYRRAALHREQVQTGAVIITGETARKENAREVLEALAGFAGEFVVATAGPDLESILAGRGAGADKYSEEHHCAVLHLDIGGGTSNLAHYDCGALRGTDCLNVGGRLVRVDGAGRVSYVSPLLAGGVAPRVGEPATPTALEPLLRAMVEELERAVPKGVRVLSFSGGVAACMWRPPDDAMAFGDIGPLLARAVRRHFEAGGFTLVQGAETIRATVIGAGAHAVEVSGSTIFYRGVEFPLKNLPVLSLSAEEENLGAAALAAAIGEKLRWYADEGGLNRVALALRGEMSPSYARVREVAAGVREGLRPLEELGFYPVVVVAADMAKVLGQAMFDGGALLCLDGIGAGNGDYIDIGAPVAEGRVLPVVVKTLAFQQRS